MYVGVYNYRGMGKQMGTTRVFRVSRVSGLGLTLNFPLSRPLLNMSTQNIYICRPKMQTHMGVCRNPELQRTPPQALCYTPLKHKHITYTCVFFCFTHMLSTKTYGGKMLQNNTLCYIPLVTGSATCGPQGPVTSQSFCNTSSLNYVGMSNC